MSHPRCVDGARQQRQPACGVVAPAECVRLSVLVKIMPRPHHRTPQGAWMKR